MGDVIFRHSAQGFKNRVCDCGKAAGSDDSYSA
jgi:hypothetical protein